MAVETMRGRERRCGTTEPWKTAAKGKRRRGDRISVERKRERKPRGGGLMLLERSYLGGEISMGRESGRLREEEKETER